MCGIFAAVELEKEFLKDDFKKFQELTNIVWYRGPDANGYSTYCSLQNEDQKGKFNIFLGHRRLSIIDISKNSNQPLELDGVCIIYNGEIFNYLELRSDLIKKGVQFETHSDTEVIIRTYQEYGEDGFKLFNGMWAFVILDKVKDRLVVSRDRFSIKPLYYHTTGTAFYFASEIKQLLPIIPEKKVNKNVLFNFLQQGLADFNEDTFFDEIRRLGCGCTMIIDLVSKRIETKKYWSFEIFEIYPDNSISQFRDLLIDSINLRLRSDVKVSSLLSGGIDSSAISLLAHFLSDAKIDTYSVVSFNNKVSEEKYIDLLVREKGLNNVKLVIDYNEILKNFNTVLYHQDEPFSTLSIVAQYSILNKIKKESGIKVVLGGQGGDELLMGYLKYYFFHLVALMRTKKYSHLISEILYSIINRTALLKSKYSLSKRYLSFLMRSNHKYLKLKGRMEETWIGDNLTDRQKEDINKYSIPVLTRYEDRNSMANSLETRHPFLDHRLVNFALSLKANQKIKNGWTKYILRQSMTELPHQIRWRRNKQGFTIPEEDWFKNNLRNEIMNLFKISRLDEMDVIDKKEFLRYYNSFLTGAKHIHYSDISRVYIAEKWARNFFH